ncbi:metalloregulator ArsR/SmtB family transcription factor [Jiangella sp. DSM 45060]|uniref:ArsR/SmtB family transcription factor n=1 Tax=Jiangella sp. DSM 45060 TaxID=1798224 RepID=UPI000879D191|nr:metalloregulator ArsR/SmtB family transcription factor [Jiangella sp. DSM 45060]SDT48798.1 DNA-binding transcriptional regulator, ArsR family [Jiangella sp. DSM 45060]
MDDDVFRALADPSRRALLDSLNRDNGQTLRQLCAGLDMARQSVSKHLAVLASAGLVTTEKRGREKLHFLNAEPINAIADRWISRYHRGRVQALADLKTALETTPVTDTEFTYTTFIRTTPEQLWKGLTDKTFTRRYWGLEFETDWTTGAPITWRIGDVTIADDEQRVLESDPFRRLAYTWHSFTPEFAAAYDFDPDVVAGLGREQRSKVTFDLEQRGEMVRLTVVHDGFEPGSQVLKDVSGGWPELIASLKTLMETGEPLPSGS